MSEHVVPTVRVQRADFDASAEVARLTSNRNDVGAVVTFTGLCRDEAGRLSALELEHYPGMAEKQITTIAADATARWPLTGMTVIHRFGRIAAGGNIVFVAAASSHRQAAFEAASFMMDFLKTKAPFWKKEHLADGTTAGWVEANDKDDKSLKKWSN
ncbi:MAG: molybdenum cofactor biosynthesis protein MoaE [Rhizobiaceae bacterium]